MSNCYDNTSVHVDISRTQSTAHSQSIRERIDVEIAFKCSGYHILSLRKCTWKVLVTPISLYRYASFYLVFIPIERFFYIYWSREATTTLLKLVNGIIFYFLFFSYCCALINKALAKKKKEYFCLRYHCEFQFKYKHNIGPDQFVTNHFITKKVCVWTY